MVQTLSVKYNELLDKQIILNPVYNFSWFSLRLNNPKGYLIISPHLSRLSLT